MGNWTITIRGVGAHHNERNPNDPNRMAASFVQQLVDAGHTVRSAHFAHSGEDDLGAGAKYNETRDDIERARPPEG